METLRVLTLNLWGDQAPLERRLELVSDGIKSLAPDVVALQEVREVPGSVPNTAATLARSVGYDFVFESATPWGGGDEGLAILSRLPVAAHRAVELPHAVPAERRICLGATITTPEGALAVFTTHLNYRLTDGGKREDQVVAADAFIAGFDSPLPKIWMGDFNAVPHSDEIRFLRGHHDAPTATGSTAPAGRRRAVWQDAWERLHVGETGYTWAARNEYARRLGWLDLDRRLDYIFVSPVHRDGRGVVRACRIVLDQPASDGVFPSDHFGLLAEIQLTPRPSYLP